MFHQTSGNPFEEESLPKAYYFPSLERHLTNNQKKTCLSPNKEHDCNPKLTSKADVKFLCESNKLSSHEVPTREDGTIQHEQSSGSQFNESWPSTDKNVSSLTQNTPSSLSIPSEREKENPSGAKISNEELHEDMLSRPSTLSKYVDRFRHGVPTSREERHYSSLASSGKDFWWISPPSNTSTPKETSADSTTSKFNSTSKSSSKIRRNATSSSPPRQKYGLRRNRFSRPVRERVEAKDPNTVDLLARTDQLLEKSENTMSEVSSESIPKPPSSWMIEKQRKMDNAAKSRTSGVKARPPPEDDILYQWRLARRLEKAQEEAQGNHIKNFSGTTSHRGRYIANIPKHDDNGTDGFKTTSSTHVARISDGTLQLDKRLNQAADDTHVSWRDKGDVRANERESAHYKARNKQEAGGNRIESNVPAVCFIDQEKVPSHVHMLCDIVPCSKQVEPGGYGVDVVKHLPSTNSDIRERTIEPRQKTFAKCNSHDYTQDEECFKRESNIRVDDIGDISEKPTTCGLTTEVHVCRQKNARTTCMERKKEQTESPDTKCLNSKMDIPDGYSSKQPVITQADSVCQTTTASSVTKPDQNEIQCEEKLDIENSSIPGETMKVLGKDELPTTLEEIVTNDTARKCANNDVAYLVGTSTPISSKSRQTRGSDDPGDQLTDIRNKGDISAVIGQVISERLFSTMSSSRRSSLNSSSISTEAGEVDDQPAKNVAVTSKECENYVKHEHTPATTGDIPFPDDDILIKLRQKADLYREHLRNIDRILEHLTE